ncbi:MAG TPA: hypothetical protein VIA06_14905 [Candidatus Dormibacteraeota bacterium]|nr:hypothetical protein [Candidatus Dormibacteraeota bacterium]
MPPRRPALTSLALSLMACLLLSGCALGPFSRMVITPSQAKQVVAAYWKVNDTVNVAAGHRKALLADLAAEETGYAFEVDRPYLVAQARLWSSTAQQKYISLKSIKVYVPRQISYPAEFLAVVSYPFVNADGTISTDFNQTFLYRFRTPSANSPWRLDFYAEYTFGSVPKLRVDSQGYAERVPMADNGQFATPPYDAAREYANFITSEAGKSNPSGIESYMINFAGQKLVLPVRIEPDEYDAYLTTGGDAFVLFTLDFNAMPTPDTNGSCMTQPRGSTATAMPFLGPLVPPGDYRFVLINQLWMMTLLTQRATAKANTSLIGFTEGDIDAVAEPCKG